MPILICIHVGDGGYVPGEMINADVALDPSNNFVQWTHRGRGRSNTFWRLAKDLELDIWYGSMANIPQTLKTI